MSKNPKPQTPEPPPEPPPPSPKIGAFVLAGALALGAAACGGPDCEAELASCLRVAPSHAEPRSAERSCYEEWASCAGEEPHPLVTIDLER